MLMIEYTTCVSVPARHLWTIGVNGELITGLTLTTLVGHKIHLDVASEIY